MKYYLQKFGLNNLLKIANDYSFKWRYSFNHSKTVIIIWGQDRNPNQVIHIGPDVLNPSKCVKHMGIKLSYDSRMCMDFCDERIGSANKVLYNGQGLGSSAVPMDTLALSKVYWAVGVPKLTYGLDITPITDPCMDKLEKAQRRHAKYIQGLPDNIPRPAPLATLGRMGIMSYIYMLIIMFMIRTLCLTAYNV